MCPPRPKKRLVDALGMLMMAKTMRKGEDQKVPRKRGKGDKKTEKMEAQYGKVKFTFVTDVIEPNEDDESEEEEEGRGGE